MMKLTAILLLTGCLQVAARSFGQQLITLNKQNALLEDVFNEIQQQTGYNFFYRDSWLKEAKKVSIAVRNVQITDALDIVLKEQPFVYSIVGKSIILRQKEINTDTTASFIDIKGKVTNENGEPVGGATITVKGTEKNTVSDATGAFELKGIDGNAILLISNVSYETEELRVKGRTAFSVQLKVRASQLSDVQVTFTTGYQTLPKERITGSFDQIDRKLINRSVSTNILDRLENLTPGLLFNKGNAATTDPFLIRGRSTIFANAQPLIVLNNFPYDGSIDNINPNDIESVTILKDAAAASIWGARAANGVIVITTKTGRSSKPQVEITTNITSQVKPNLFSVSKISSSDFIELEKYLFANNYYNSAINSSNHQSLTPVVELLVAKSNGTIPAAEADAQIEALKQYDVRNDLKKYAYRTSINQQYAFNVSGNTSFVNYYMSAGYDRNLPNLVGQQYERITLRTQNTFKVTNNLQIDAGINYLQSINKTGNNAGYNFISNKLKNYYPYARLADDNGNPLPFYGDYRKYWLDTAGAGKLLDWTYYPLKEIYNQENKTTTRDYVLNVGIRYKILNGLNAEVKYQYENQLATNNNLYKESSYYARDYINNFTQIDWENNSIRYPVPLGGILDQRNTEITSHQGRAQLNYSQALGIKHRIAAIAGYEIRSIVTTGNRTLYYGYNAAASQVNNSIDYITRFKQYSSTASQAINGAQVISKLTDHFLSYYANAAYTYNDRYILSASGRIDQANLFGVKANQKGTPLWSVGGAWIINKENFYRSSWLPELKIRATYGYNGNISRQTSAYTTASYSTADLSPAQTARIRTPPNENLRWEKVGIVNIGIDFATRNNVLSGTIEYYHKHAKDLMGQAPVDPTLGIPPIDQPSFYGNIAGMKGHGFDVTLNSRNLDGKFKWYSNLIFSQSISKVSEYLMPVSSTGRPYLTPTAINPVIGKPLFSMYSLRWNGLDPENGDPIGYYDGKSSKDYSSIYNNTKLDTLVYNGPVQPTLYGALRNTFAYNGFSLSFNISYKFNYYFRTQSVSYSTLFSYWTGNGDYAKRWQKPGDELTTHVPSLIYPSNSARESFYMYSEILIQKADNIRLEDATISYDLDRSQFKKLPFSHFRIYLYASNLGTLWKANKYDIDPYYNNVLREGRKISIGANIIF